MPTVCWEVYLKRGIPCGDGANIGQYLGGMKGSSIALNSSVGILIRLSHPSELDLV